MASFSLRPSVYEDIQRAVDYYDLINPKLSEAFLDEIEDCFANIQDLPEDYQERLGKIRIAFLRRFSFGVSYKLYDTRIIFIAVFHTSQDPDNWKGKE
ncbi:type II toxin-antitoxin system RelE/ParE family toxin [Roseivirga echinicomitans]|uniref:Plasmid stabilization protein n=1 Tax=Roseivirga echinicomitans TaxID=296218 RepID=A0A150XUC9_9BACT|nr:type II toxin-antitoxin system RelE/ParE family toxin [Roseivirga echinicomitans]KYG82340.1 hypothetical protein AWN68_16010 [Roseivirga echinicomitans]